MYFVFRILETTYGLYHIRWGACIFIIHWWKTFFSWLLATFHNLGTLIKTNNANTLG